jgi:nucleoside-diphosphate-sugar epimerase
VTGSIEHRETAARALDGVTHVLHLATSKETPGTVMDVAVKGLFWLLEACRASAAFRQFILIGGDAGIGHFFYPRPAPVTEAQPLSAYPGCYALSKVLEEVMTEQYGIQYDLNTCCLRAPWIMEKDDFRYQLSFGEDVFGGPRWRDLVGPEQASAYLANGTVPVLLDGEGRPVKRNFVHVDDLTEAILSAIDNPAARQQTFNICMDEPVDYGELATYLAQTRGLPSAGVRTPYHSTWLDNTKAKFLLGWRPRYDLRRLTDEAWDYQRAPDDPRVLWYPG